MVVCPVSLWIAVDAGEAPSIHNHPKFSCLFHQTLTGIFQGWQHLTLFQSTASYKPILERVGY